MAPPGQSTVRLFGRGTWPEASRIAEILRTETVGGLLLVGAAVLALVWANSPWRDGYTALAGTPSDRRRCTWTSPWPPGPPTACSRSSSSSPGWSSNASSSPGPARPARAPPCRSPPPSAGWSYPPLIYLAHQPRHRRRGAARAGRSRPPPTSPSPSPCSPSISTHLPSALRTFLLTLAVVDDLLAITIIAIFYTSDLKPAAPRARADPARPVRRARAAPRPLLVAAAAAGRRHLGAGARVRASTPPSPGCCSASPSPSSAAPPAARAGPGLGRTLRAPLPPDLGRFRRPGLRVLRRRRRPSVGARRARRRAHRHRHPRHHRRTRASASPSASSAPPGWSPASPAPASPTD